jgi:hypothetical protein
LICMEPSILIRFGSCCISVPACNMPVLVIITPWIAPSLSLTAQSAVYVGLLRQHSAAPLGTSNTCVILHRK